MLLKCEKETIIILNDDEKVAHVSTSQDWMKRKIRKLAEEYPDEVKIISEDQWTIIATMPKKYNIIRHPRVMSEENRIACIERLKKIRENKNKTNE